VPREDESSLRPAGFRALPGGLSVDGFAKLSPKSGEGIALASEDGPWIRAAIPMIAKAAPDSPILVLSDKLTDDDLPEHPCVRRAGLETLIRDDIDEEFSHLTNLRRVVELRSLLECREKVAVLLQPDPDPDGIACGYALRIMLGRNRLTAPLVSFGEVKRPENRALVQALGIEILTVTPEDLEEFDGLALVDVQPNVFGDEPPARLRSIDVVIDHHPERPGYDSVIKDIRTSYGATATILTEYLRASELEINSRLATARNEKFPARMPVGLYWPLPTRSAVCSPVVSGSTSHSVISTQVTAGSQPRESMGSWGSTLKRPNRDSGPVVPSRLHSKSTSANVPRTC
jgi:hypothetical protein